MGWGPPDCLPHLLRDGLTLRLTCECGHVAEPDVRELIGALGKLGGYRLALADLRHNLRCGHCGGKRFGHELIGPSK